MPLDRRTFLGTALAGLPSAVPDWQMDAPPLTAHHATANNVPGNSALISDPLQRRTRAELSVFVDWCSRGPARGCGGAIGVPNGKQGRAGDGARWARLLEEVVAYLRSRQISVLAWAADSRLGLDYELAIYRAIRPDGPLATGNPAAEALERHVCDEPVFVGLGNHALANADHRDGFSNVEPGRFGVDYFREEPASFAFLAARGHKIMRLAFRWERLQPILGGELRSVDLEHLVGQVADANAVGLRVILDLHNYGEYVIAPGWIAADGGGPGRRTVGSADGTVTELHLVDFWLKLSAQFQSNKAVLAYGLMNEPHDLADGPAGPPGARPLQGARLWEHLSQAVVSALRRAGDRTLVLVAGYEWSKADRWADNHQAGPWISDPADRVMYEAHYYPDGESSAMRRGDSVFGPYTYEQAVADALRAGY